VARLAGGQKEDPQPELETLPPVPTEYEDLHAPEAIEYVDKVSDPQILRAILQEEKRKTVLEAINQRLKELEG
jgi:hypothetical protein